MAKILDQQFNDRANALIAELELEKDALYPEQES